MAAAREVIVVGAGFAGLAAAIGFADAGLRVRVLERDKAISPLGSGITLQGNALRCLEALGVGDEVRARSWAFDVLGFRDAGDGRVIATVEAEKAGGPDFPATAGMYRPELARILFERATALGVQFTWTSEVTSVREADERVVVGTADGVHYEADLVIGADGLKSRLRHLLGIETDGETLGMGIWRGFVPRLPEITHTELTYGGAAHYVGYCPTGEDSMYVYVVEELTDRSALGAPERIAIMRELAATYPAPWDRIAPMLDESAQVNYTAITRLAVPAPWNRGRVVLIGDAVHSCPPTLAQGAAQALEDASVIVDVVAHSERLDDDMWARFHRRRVDRAIRVVDGSVTLSDWQREGRSGGDAAELMRGIATMLAVPA